MAKTEAAVAIKDEYTELMEQRKYLAQQRRDTNAKIRELRDQALAEAEAKKTPEQKVYKNLQVIFKDALKKVESCEFADALAVIQKQAARELKEAMNLPSAK